MWRHRKCFCLCWSCLSLGLVVVVVLDAELFLHLTVVEDAEDVLAGAVDGAAEEEVGEAKVVVFSSQLIVTILK